MNLFYHRFQQQVNSNCRTPNPNKIYFTFSAQTSTVRQAVKRKRKLVIDELKEIDSGSMKTQLSDTTDIVGVLELAPPTRRLMHLKETGGIEKLFSLSATSIFSKTLQQVKKLQTFILIFMFCFSLVNHT